MTQLAIERAGRGVSAADGTTKAKIERAALTLFAENGIDGVSTKQIAAKAGISEGAIYRHFFSKEELAKSLMKAIHERLTEMIIVAQEHEGLENQIKFIINHYCQIADDDWTLFRYHLLHLYHFPRLSDDPDRTPQRAAAKLLETAMSRGDIPKADPDLLAAMSLGIVVQTAQAKNFGYIDAPLSSYIDIFTRAIFAVFSFLEAN